MRQKMPPPQVVANDKEIASGGVVEVYKADVLGCPFDVYLIDSVRKYTGTKGEERFVIPNLRGLKNAVAVARCLHSRKLGPSEIKSVRKLVGSRAIDVANSLGISAEHLSRCEAGDRVLSVSAEKLLRILIVDKVAPCPSAFDSLLVEIEKRLQEAKSNHSDPLEKLKAEIADFQKSLNTLRTDYRQCLASMKLESVFDVGKPLEFRFQIADTSCPEHGDDDAKWDEMSAAIAA